MDLAQTVNMDTDETSDIGNDDADNNLDICVLLLNHIRYFFLVFIHLRTNSLICILDGVRLYTILKY